MTGGGPEAARFLRSVPRAGARLSGRVYVGDETCERRLPGEGLMDWLEAGGGAALDGVTLMTPFLSDAGADRVEELLRRLSRVFPSGFEVVVNDLGVLQMLEAGPFPAAAPVCGRLIASRYMFFPDFPEDFLSFLVRHRMAAVELNSAEQLRATRPALKERGIRTHIHWPWMHLTASRFCAADVAFEGSSRDTISACGRGCEDCLGTVTAPGGREILLRGNAYMTRQEGTAPPQEADRIVEDDPPLASR